ncbi:hypothetical protein GCM10022243_32380 [Saccharothrix violaceirubra]
MRAVGQVTTGHARRFPQPLQLAPYIRRLRSLLPYSVHQSNLPPLFPRTCLAIVVTTGGQRVLGETDDMRIMASRTVSES